MDEATQAKLLPTMPEKDLTKLIKRLEAQVADLEHSIAYYEKSITVAGAQEQMDKADAAFPDLVNAPGRLSVEAFISRNKQYYGKTNQTRKAKLITKTRRLNAAREEVGKRNRQVIFGSRESLA